MSPLMIQRIKELAEILSSAKQARVVSHHDADGIAAAGIICKSLLRENIKFHCTCIRDFSAQVVREIQAEKSFKDLVIFLDLGSSELDEIEKLQHKIIIVLDHHVPLRESKIRQVNPWLFGFDGTYEVCASTLAMLLAEARNEKNFDLIGLALAGIVGDKQLPVRGLNHELVERGVAKGEIKLERGLSISGLEPFFKEPLTIDRSNKRYFNSLALLRLLKQGASYEALEQRFNYYYLPRYKLYARELASVLDACGRTDNSSLGIAICLNSELAEKGAELKNNYHNEVKKEVLKVSTRIKELKNLQYFQSDNPSLAGVVAGILSAWLLKHDKPVLALSETNNKIKVSARGSRALVEKGLDLAAVTRKSSEAVGGYGGGHNIAAGATIPQAKGGEFLKIADEIIGKQLRA